MAISLEPILSQLLNRSATHIAGLTRAQIKETEQVALKHTSTDEVAKQQQSQTVNPSLAVIPPQLLEATQKNQNQDSEETPQFTSQQASLALSQALSLVKTSQLSTAPISDGQVDLSAEGLQRVAKLAAENTDTTTAPQQKAEAPQQQPAVTEQKAEAPQQQPAVTTEQKADVPQQQPAVATEQKQQQREAEVISENYAAAAISTVSLSQKQKENLVVAENKVAAATHEIQPAKRSAEQIKQDVIAENHQAALISTETEATNQETPDTQNDIAAKTAQTNNQDAETASTAPELAQKHVEFGADYYQQSVDNKLETPATEVTQQKLRDATVDEVPTTAVQGQLQADLEKAIEPNMVSTPRQYLEKIEDDFNDTAVEFPEDFIPAPGITAETTTSTTALKEQIQHQQQLSSNQQYAENTQKAQNFQQTPATDDPRTASQVQDGTTSKTDIASLKSATDNQFDFNQAQIANHYQPNQAVAGSDQKDVLKFNQSYESTLQQRQLSNEPLTATSIKFDNPFEREKQQEVSAAGNGARIMSNPTQFEDGPDVVIVAIGEPIGEKADKALRNYNSQPAISGNDLVQNTPTKGKGVKFTI